MKNKGSKKTRGSLVGGFREGDSLAARLRSMAAFAVLMCREVVCCRGVMRSLVDVASFPFFSFLDHWSFPVPENEAD